MSFEVAVLGSGAVGRTLAAAWSDAGLRVVLGSRRPEDEDLVTWATGTDVALRGVVDAVAVADVVVLAVAWNGVDPTLAAIANALAATPLVDVTNPLRVVDGELFLSPSGDDSGAEYVQRMVPGTAVAKAFNTVGLEQFDRRDLDRFVPAALPIAGEEAAVAAASRLAEVLGWRPLPVGGLRAARRTEPLALLWIEHAIRTGERDHLITFTAGVRRGT